MDVNVFNGIIPKHVLDYGPELAALNDFRRDEISHGIVSSHGQKPVMEHLRDFIDCRLSRLAMFPYKNRPRCPVRRIGVMMSVRNQQHPFPDFGILQRYAAGVSRLSIYFNPLRMARLQFFVAHS